MRQNDDHDRLLTPAQMTAVDQAAALSGLDSYDLMERAGRSVAAAFLRRYPGALRAVVLCGPGNNGGDGHVAARVLRDSGVAVAVFSLREPSRLKGDALTAHAHSGLPVDSLSAYHPRQGDVVIDALFGAGLDRDVPPEVADVVDEVTRASLPVLAVDLPSGLDGRTGQVLGRAFAADHTVTFVAFKPGHLLLPGRQLCGSVECVDIGIPRRLVLAHAGPLWRNHPRRWAAHLPGIAMAGHKYVRGHLVVFSGSAMATGAARLSAQAGLRAGAGLVTVAAPEDALAANAAHLTAVMLKKVDTESDLAHWLEDTRLTTFVLGPGFGIGEKARRFTHLLSRRNLVLDADGITSFRDDPQALFSAFAGGKTRLVLTPHDGEFARLFPDLATDPSLGKVERAVRAAARANAAVVLKGGDTVIAAPDGRALINTDAPPSLATAGSGDVLAGIIGGLLSAGMPAFEAAAAGVWMHGEAAKRAGQGLTADDLANAVCPL